MRREVLNTAAREPAPAELQQLKALVERALKAGALGLSTGLAYVPGRFAETAEVLALARVTAQYGGLYVSHIRNEAHGGGRGYLQPGAWADVVIFDPATIKGEADYDEPLAAPTGIEYVIVNGALVLEHGALNNERPAGKALRRTVPPPETLARHGRL